MSFILFTSCCRDSSLFLYFQIIQTHENQITYEHKLLEDPQYDQIDGNGPIVEMDQSR